MNSDTNSINFRQLAIGFSLLFLGIGCYLFGRNPDRVFFIYNFQWLSSLNLEQYGIVNDLCKSLPSFLHSCSFTLLSCAFLPAATKRKYVFICLIWACIGILFEFGQLAKPNLIFKSSSIHWLSNIVDLTTNYFNNGTFDYYDILNTLLGCFAAYIILVVTYNGGCNDFKKTI